MTNMFISEQFESAKQLPLLVIMDYYEGKPNIFD